MLRRATMSDVLPRVLGAFFGRTRRAIAGVAAIELSLVSPLLITGVLGAGELGITIYRETQVSFAAQAGINYAIAHGFDVTAVSNAIVNSTKYVRRSLLRPRRRNFAAAQRRPGWRPLLADRPVRAVSKRALMSKPIQRRNFPRLFPIHGKKAP